MLDRFLAEDSHPTPVSVLPELLDSIVVYDWITGLLANLSAKQQVRTVISHVSANIFKRLVYHCKPISTWLW